MNTTSSQTWQVDGEAREPEKASQWIATATAAWVIAPSAVTVVEPGGYQITLRDLVLLAISLVITLRALNGRARLRMPLPGLVLPIVLLVAGGAMVNHRPYALPEWILVAVVPLIVGATMARDELRRRRVMAGLAFGLAVVAVMALIERYRGHGFFVGQEQSLLVTRLDSVRATAGWVWPTILAAFICLAGFMLIDWARARHRIGAIVAALVVAMSVIATQSRAGLAGMVVGALVYVALQPSVKDRVRMVVSVSLGMMVLLFVAGSRIERIRTFLAESLVTGSDANANVSYRQSLYQRMFDAMANHATFGFGFGSGSNVGQSSLARFFGDYTDLASLPLSLSVQIGYPATALVYLTMLVAFVRSWRRRTEPGFAPAAAGLSAAAVALVAVPVSAAFSVLMFLIGVFGQAPEPSPIAAATAPPLSGGQRPRTTPAPPSGRPARTPTRPPELRPQRPGG